MDIKRIFYKGLKSLYILISIFVRMCTKTKLKFLKNNVMVKNRLFSTNIGYFQHIINYF
jgi:hypothetical protein